MGPRRARIPRLWYHSTLVWRVMKKKKKARGYLLPFRRQHRHSCPKPLPLILLSLTRSDNISIGHVRGVHSELPQAPPLDPPQPDAAWSSQQRSRQRCAVVKSGCGYVRGVHSELPQAPPLDHPQPGAEWSRQHRGVHGREWSRQHRWVCTDVSGHGSVGGCTRT